MTNPEHEDHADMKKWIGGKLDPEKFSVDKVLPRHRRSSYTNPTLQRGECLEALAGASGWYMEGCGTFLPG